MGPVGSPEGPEGKCRVLIERQQTSGKTDMNIDVPEVRLSRKAERLYAGPGGHPWIFSGSLSEEPEGCAPGSVVRVSGSDGAFLCFGHYNPLSSIRVRALTFSKDEFPDWRFFASRIRRAYESRTRLEIASDSFRAVFSESDGLPGLTVDKYGDFAVVQTSTAGMDAMKTDIARAVAEICEVRGVVEKNDCEIRRLEGLPELKGVLRGDSPPELITIKENGLDFLVSLLDGQKTGFYLDQRENRAAVARFAKEGMEILDVFCFSGGFSAGLLKSGANSTVLLDDSAPALELALRNLEQNGITGGRAESVKGNAFEMLRKFRDQGRQFDMVVLDPPKFAPTIRDADRAERGYKDINIMGMKLLRPGGLLATFSCSSGMSRERFKDILRKAARDCGKDAAVILSLGQPPDHPCSLAFPESEYLKGFVCEIRN